MSGKYGFTVPNLFVEIVVLTKNSSLFQEQNL